MVCEKSVAVFDGSTGELSRTWNRSQAHYAAAWSPDGDRFAVSLSAPASITVLDLAASEAIAEFQHDVGDDAEVYDACYSGDDRRLATIGGNSLKLWDTSTQSAVYSRTLDRSGFCVAASPDGKRLGYGGEWGLTIDEPMTAGRPSDVFTSGATCLSFSPDGEILASGHLDSKIRLWNAATGDPIAEFTGHAQRVNSLAFHPRGRILASASEDGAIRLWSVKLNREVGVVYRHPAQAYGVAFSPDGRRLAASFTHHRGLPTVKMWNARFDD